MALSVVDLYSRVLPKTNCGECGFKTCLAFAGMVVSEQYPLKNCPYIPEKTLEWAVEELAEQYSEGKWLKKDMASEALQLAKGKITSSALENIARRIGGRMQAGELLLPYFATHLHINAESIADAQGHEISRNEQTFIYIHMAMGGKRSPTGTLKSFKEFPNTISKVVSMKAHVETPLKNCFSAKCSELVAACRQCGGQDVKSLYPSPDVAFLFRVLPLVPATLLFWDESEGFEAEVKLLFDETITDQLDIEAIMFLSETLANRLCSTERTAQKDEMPLSDSCG